MRRVKWDDRLAPENWNYDEYGRPDVVYMELGDAEKQGDIGPIKKEQQESKLESNKNYLLAHDVPGVDRSHYNHPLPENVYDIYVRYWGGVTFK
jgi:hypothetical protein